jgi:hypothetical protein
MSAARCRFDLRAGPIGAVAFVASVASVAWVGGGGAAVVPTPIGVGKPFHPRASNPLVEQRLPVGSLTCSRSERPRLGVHLELFARNRVVIVPAGIGIGPPRRSTGPYVLGGGCSYPVRTREPTGVIEFDRSTRLTLGDFFATWGRPLTPSQFLGFRASHGQRIRAYVGGHRWSGNVRAIPLRAHAEIVLEVGPYVEPHVAYRFRDGL